MRVVDGGVLVALLSACSTEVSDDDLAALEARIAALEAENDDLRADLDAALTSEDLDDYVSEASLTTALDGYVTSTSLSTSLAGYATTGVFSAVENRVAALEAGAVTLLSEDLVIDVPGNEGITLHDALASIDRYRIARDATVTIQIADSVTHYEFDVPLVFNHPDGDRIFVVGNLDTPGAVTLEYTGTDTGGAVRVAANATLGGFDGITLVGPGDGSGLLASQNGSILATEVIVTGFDLGYFATQGGYVRAPSTHATDNVTVGYYAVYNGTIYAPDSTTAGSANGYRSDAGSTIYASGAEATGHVAGLLADNGSVIYAVDTIMTDNTWGILARRGAAAYVDGADLVDNTTGVQSQRGAFVEGTGLTYTNNDTNAVPAASPDTSLYSQIVTLP